MVLYIALGCFTKQKTTKRVYMGLNLKITFRTGVAVFSAVSLLSGSVWIHTDKTRKQEQEATAYAAVNPGLLLLGNGNEVIEETLQSVEEVSNKYERGSERVLTAAFFNAPSVEYTDVTSAATANLTVPEETEGELTPMESSQYVYNAPVITDIGSIEALRACLLAEVGSNAYAYCATFVSKFINKNVNDNSRFYPSCVGVTDSPLILLSELMANPDYNEAGRITGASVNEINNFLATNGQPGDIIIYIGRARGDYVHCGIFFDAAHYTYDQGISGIVRNGSIYWYLYAVKGTGEEATGAILYRPGKTGTGILAVSGTDAGTETIAPTLTPDEEMSVSPDAEFAGDPAITGEAEEVVSPTPEASAEETADAENTASETASEGEGENAGITPEAGSDTATGNTSDTENPAPTATTN